MMPIFAWSIYYDLPVLLVVFSIVYSASRHDDWKLIFRESVGWLLRMTSFLAGLGILLYVLSTYSQWWKPIAIVVGIGYAIFYYLTSPFFKTRREARQEKVEQLPPSAATPAK